MSRRIKPFALALFILLAATLPLAFLPPAALAATPITNCTELQNIRNNSGGDYYLANDINCSCTSGWNGGAGFEPIGSSKGFTGTLDGKGYKITHLYINRTSTEYVGLFGYTGSGSEIKDVGLEEVDVRGDSYVGGLVGDNYGTITNSYSSGTVSGDGNVGGLVGVNDGTIKNSYSSGTDVSSDDSVGGLVGDNYGTITNSYSSGTVSGSSAVGGLVGFNYGTITNSYSSGSVSGSSDVGGLVGLNGDGTITNSYSSGSVSGSSKVGGLVGVNGDGTITNSYSSGSVSGSSKVGGLVGENVGTITNSYWDIYRSKRSNCVGSGLSSGCTGKNSGNSEPDYWYYRTHAPMNNWDFDNVWGIVEGVTYPYLQWQFAVNCTCGDICVSETGWWRDGGEFKPSNMPIQHAIENATAGDTICVKDGTYNENVNVNKRLTIKSENCAASTVVQAASSNDPVFEVTADYVNISGFHVTGATKVTSGIYLYGANYCNISDNNANDNFYHGIFLNSSNDNTLVNNSASDNSDYGIYLSHSSDNTLTRNTASDNLRGIYLSHSSDNTLVNNTPNLNDWHGIELSSSSNNNLVNNTMTGNLFNFGVSGSTLSHFIQNIDTSNTVDGKPIYYWVDQQNRAIPNDAGYVGVVNSTNITVRDLTLTKNGEGVLFAYTGDSIIENVIVSNNYRGGIYLYSSCNNNIMSNTASHNNYDGIYLW